MFSKHENEYTCKKCGLTFRRCEVTAENNQGLDLCPACCHPIVDRLYYEIEYGIVDK